MYKRVNMVAGATRVSRCSARWSVAQLELVHWGRCASRFSTYLSVFGSEWTGECWIRAGSARMFWDCTCCTCCRSVSSAKTAGWSLGRAGTRIGPGWCAEAARWRDGGKLRNHFCKHLENLGEREDTLVNRLAYMKDFSNWIHVIKNWFWKKNLPFWVFFSASERNRTVISSMSAFSSLEKRQFWKGTNQNVSPDCKSAFWII